MLQDNYNKETYQKISLILIFATLCIYVYMLYLTYFGIFSKFWQSPVFTSLLIKIHGLVPNPIINMGIVIIFYSSAWMTFSPTKTIDPDRKRLMGQIGMTALLLFAALAIVQYYRNLGIIGVGFNLLFFFFFFIPLLEWRKTTETDLRKDRRNVIESQFDQYKEKIDTPYSVNIPFKYFYNKLERMSWVNIVNPFRAILVGGVPGSGKSFASIEEIMRQFTKKKFTGVVYDFKFPTLTTKQYNYLDWYSKNYDVEPHFYVVNFDDPEYSHRCNPINVDTLQTIADAEENTKVLMLNINKTWIEKEGDFFTDSANVFTAMLMWYLKLLTDKYDYDVCSFPHLVALSTFESTEILFLILKEYNDLKPKMKPFSEALEKGALEQLAGQVASAGVALSKISSVELNYILTGDDFSFDLNNPLAPKILCIGNNPDRQMTYSAPIGLIMTKLSKTMNRQGQLPSMYCVDEFPTVYVRGIDNLIATARSNKIATVLGFQSFAQIIVNYGKEISDQLVRICGTRLMGQMMDDDAEIIAKNIGKQKIQTSSYSYSANDVSKSTQVTLEDIVPASHISQFSQGTFCGVVADDFAYKDENKIFVGELSPPLKLKKREEDKKLPKIYDMSPENIDELFDTYNVDHAYELKKISDILMEETNSYWIKRLEETTTERNFYESLIQQHELDYQTYRPIFDQIDFKNTLLVHFQGILKKSSPKELHRHFEEEELQALIHQMVRDGLKKSFKNEYLQAWNDNIYNEIYRVIAMEIENLGIVEEIKSMKDRKPKENAARFFTKILNSDKLKMKEIEEKYQNFINILTT